MVCENLVFGGKTHNGSFEKHRFDAAQADSSEPRYPYNALQEIEQSHVPFLFASVGSEMYAGEDYFLKAFIHEGTDFGENVFGAGASSRTPYLRNDAIGTPGVASVLQFDQGTCFPSRLCHGPDGAGARVVQRRTNNAFHGVWPVPFQDIRNLFPGGVPENHFHAGKGSQQFGISFGITAGDDYSGRSILAMQSPDRLAHLLVGAVCHRAGVYND